MVPETWRVVFSSTGDLAPAGTAVRPGEPPSRMWIDAARFPLARARSVLDALATLVIPSDCRVCSQPLVRVSRIPVCDRCVSTLEPKRVNACSICAEALEFAVPDALCGVCCRVPPNFDFAISFSAYDGSLRKLLHLLKYEQLRPAANLIGAKLAEAFAQREFAGKQPVRLIPVPLHRAKRRQRGFNQSERIARSVLQHLDTSRFELHAGNRRRVRATVSQTGLTRHQRRENVRGAFAITAPEQVRDRSVIIVDDVYTGTTLNECARVLRKAGAAQVVVATAARVYRTGSEIKLTRVETQHAASQAGQEENATAFTRAVAG